MNRRYDMIWRIECYDGTLWISPVGMSLTRALVRFTLETVLPESEIKIIINLGEV